MDAERAHHPRARRGHGASEVEWRVPGALGVLRRVGPRVTPAGRPEVGKPINIRLGDELLAEVDAWAEGQGIKRAEAIRRLVERGLRRNRR
ncbi:ribbon-helix-helix protein, CopG family [Mycolicibacterium wolinskyi]|uniref:ribbon-helix-helix domain-containing protein n=1 Tax=Mycolicibacterium TaxID=1866885 RepID=UPI000A1571D4|nr:ribbon-helix-helix protein, CopG family [Mycolicibacterium wolinskyi]MCV7296185.1 ribbon-helix-helix protein, CopG family [Mycolicibacterium goodii]